MTTSKKRKLKRLLILTPLGLILMVGLIALLALTGPTGYAPQSVAEPQGRQAENYAIEKSQQVYNSINRVEPFTLTLDEPQLNTLITWLYDNLQAANPKGTPPIFQHPQIRLAKNKIFVMGNIDYKGTNVVLSLGVAPKILPDGQLEIRLLPIRVGRIPLPQKLTDPYLKNIVQSFAKNAPASVPTKDHKKRREQETVDVWSIVEPYLNQLLETHRTAVPPEFVIDSEKTAKITDLKLTPGRIDLTVLPAEVKRKYN